MNDSLEAAIKEAYVLAPAGKHIIHTLEIRQTGVQDTVYLAQSRVAVVALDEDGNSRTFEPSGFQFSLPPVTEEGFPTLSVAIDNIDRRVTDFINTAKTSEVPVELWYRPYLSDDLTGPQMDPPVVMYLQDVNIAVHQVTGRATFVDLVNKKFPSIIYDRTRFPTLG
jgi:hypothetical protein